MAENLEEVRMGRIIIIVIVIKGIGSERRLGFIASLSEQSLILSNPEGKRGNQPAIIQSIVESINESMNQSINQ